LLDPYDLIAGGVIASGMLLMAIGTGRIRWLMHPACLVSVVLLCASHRTLWPIQVSISASYIGLLIYGFGRHWSYICTASPVSIATATTYREIWQTQLLVLALIGGVLVAVTLATEWVILRIAILTLPLATLALPNPMGLRTSWCRMLCDSFVSWFTYDAPEVPGLLQSPAGNSIERRGLAIACAALTTMVLICFSESPFAQLISFGESHAAYFRDLGGSDRLTGATFDQIEGANERQERR
jgi:hypothetical protein